MKILIIGGTGMVGSRVLAEATSRGHHSTAVARSHRPRGHAGSGDDGGGSGSLDGGRGTASADEGGRAGSLDVGGGSAGSPAVGRPPTPAEAIADAADPEAIAPLVAAHEVSVLAIRPARGQESALPVTTGVVLDAALAADRPVLVVGGAGPLRIPGRPGVRLLDDPRYVPRAWRAIAQASVWQWEVCTGRQARWSYLSPPAILTPGQRTGRYRRGGGILLTDADGTSQITAEDLAVAVVDELEHGPGRGHWTVAY